MELAFPSFITCVKCERSCRVNRREACDMPEGAAGVAWARCKKCKRNFIRFIGEELAAAVLKDRWLSVR